MSVQCHVLLVCVSAVSSDATALSEASAMCNPDSLQCMAGKFKHTFQRISGTSRSLTQLKTTRRLTSAGTEAACLTTPLLLCFMRCVWRSPWQALPRQVPQFVQSISAKAQACHCTCIWRLQMAKRHLLCGCVPELSIVLQEVCPSMLQKRLHGMAHLGYKPLPLPFTLRLCKHFGSKH